VSEALFRLFEGLPRQGPGSDACTRAALRRLGELPAAPRVLDLGCGSGRSALVLAETLRTKVVAITSPSWISSRRRRGSATSSI
jgi:SAM-dependent methyltransferase